MEAITLLIICFGNKISRKWIMHMVAIFSEKIHKFYEKKIYWFLLYIIIRTKITSDIFVHLIHLSLLFVENC